MCGIFGYSGKQIKVIDLINGLQRLEYRGYDSCGIAGLKNGKFFIKKRQGKIEQLREGLKNAVDEYMTQAILHTRWATHGRPSYVNSHPHADCFGNIAVVHNGIIENYAALKSDLIKQGHIFVSQTDTEIIAHLIEMFYKDSLQTAARKAIDKLKGSFALGVICKQEPNTIIACRKGSPLIIGLASQGSFIASDIPALLSFTNRVIYLKDNETAVLSGTNVKIFGFDGKPITSSIEKITISTQSAEKKEYEHFMLKEIFEQPEVLKKTLSLYVKRGHIEFPQINLSTDYFRRAGKIFITACGTAYHAGFAAKYFLEKYCKIDVEIDTSSEFRYRPMNIKKEDMLITISQSGETADTLAAAQEAKRKGAKILAVCNVLGSSLTKESHSLIYTPAGPEIGVASTKAYTAQVFALFLFGLYLAKIKKSISKSEYKNLLSELEQMPMLMKDVLRHADKVCKIAGEFAKFGCFLFLGRGINFPSALEGALKLKEISYIPAEGYAAGEMKHGPIALIDEYRGVVCIAPKDELYEKMISNIQEIKARKGVVLSILSKGDSQASILSDAVILIPYLKYQAFSSLLAAVALQLFAYYMAKNLGHNIDQPRNLAKSVTVE